MHRSGTSLVASMLHQMGINMGERIIPPDENNPYGYWEDEEILDVNKAILGSLDVTWRKFVTRNEIFSVRGDHLADLKKIVAKKEKKDISKQLWGFKDPRTCLTVWLWHEVLSAPKYVIVQRNRRDTTKSLRKAYGPGNWYDLIKHYNQHIRAFVNLHQGVSTYYISYDNLIRDDAYSIASAVGLASFAECSGQAEKALRAVRSKEQKNE
jgi:hypothetical protein